MRLLIIADEEFACRKIPADELNLDESESSAGQTVETFTVITTTPNPMVAKVHDRMPVILGPEHYQWWLQPKFDPELLKTLLRPYPAEDMECHQVSKLVNSAKNDSAECLEAG
jgi:putative SOS response-associated peptidase YedK